VVDEDGTNAAAHGERHISIAHLLRLIRQQIKVDRGSDADCCPLFIHGSRGALLKVRLNPHGYTMVGKAVEAHNLVYLRHERNIYDRLSPLHVRSVPVCVGQVDLEIPYYYDGAELKHVLFMSWAGKSLA